MAVDAWNETHGAARGAGMSPDRYDELKAEAELRLARIDAAARGDAPPVH